MSLSVRAPTFNFGDSNLPVLEGAAGASRACTCRHRARVERDASLKIQKIGGNDRLA